MERVEEQEKELRWFSTILEQTQRGIHNSSAQADVEAASEREFCSAPDMTPHASPPSQSPTLRIQGLHEEMFDIFPSTVNMVREAVSRVRQMPNIAARYPNDDSLVVLLTQADRQIQGMSIADARRFRFTDRERMGMSSTPKRPVSHGSQDPEDISQIPREEDVQLGRQHHLAYQEGLINNFQLAATEFHKIWDPKITKLKGGNSSTVSLLFQSWLKDIWIHASEWRLSQSGAMQLVRDFTCDHARLEMEYYFGMYPEDEQSFQGLIDQLTTAFQFGETEKSLIGDFYKWHPKA